VKETLNEIDVMKMSNETPIGDTLNFNDWIVEEAPSA
jgi:hypothetical protein